MPKKCIICGKEARFYIKGTSDYYCEECAKEHFSDLSLLVGIEEQAEKIKKIVEEKSAMSESEEEEKRTNN